MIDLQTTRARRGAAKLASAVLAPAARVQLAAILALLLLCVAFLHSAPLNTRYDFSPGGVGAPLTRGFNLAETTADGRGFRWTDGDSSLDLPAQSEAAHTLRLRLSAPRPDSTAPVPIAISVNGQPLIAVDQGPTARHYAVLIPSTQMRLGVNAVRIESPTFQPAEVNREARALGVVVFEVGWHALGPTPWLLPAQIGAIAIALLLLALLLTRFAIALPWRLLVLALFTAILLAMRHSDARFVYRWHAVLATLLVAALLAVALAVTWRRTRQGALLGEPARPDRGAGPTPPLLLVLAGYSLATALMLWPLLTVFTTQVPGGPGDNWEYLWKMGWFGEALVGQLVSPTFAPQLFYPGGAELTISELAPAHNLLYMPVTLLAGPVVSYNLALLVSFVLSGLFTYLLARRLGASAGAAFVAGLIYAFSVRRFFHINGHFGMMGSQWLPLLLYAWEGLLTRRRPWDAFLAGLAYVLCAWSTLIYGTIAPILIIGYTLLRIPPRAWLTTLRQIWPLLVLMAAISVALVVPAVQPYYEAQQEGLTYGHQYIQILMNAVRPEYYLLPNPFHPLWGAWASQLYRPDGGEHFASPGYTALLLGLLGLWVGRRRIEIRALALLLLGFAVLSLGPELPLAEQRSLPLPAKLLFDYLPVFGNIRTWGRMVFFVMLCLALLAAVGLSALPRRLSRWSWALAAALVLIESASALQFSAPQPRPVDLWLRAQPGSGGVVHLPYRDTPPQEFYTLLFSGKPVSQGHGKFLPAAYREGRNIYVRFPDESSLRLMQRWQTDYIVVEEATMDQLRPDWRATLAALPLATWVYAEGGYSVYRLTR
ncbi:MAG: YfhO family protein [Chloroflexales bacterium]|nr:YfhO family protein [Chloroflexales bacterium]